MRQVRNFIDGEFVDAASGKTFPSISPIDNEPIAEVAQAGKADVDRAVAAARAAFPAWAAMDPDERKAILFRIADGIEARIDELAEWESRDMGKPFAAAQSKDMPRSAHNFRYFAEFAAHTTTIASDRSYANSFGYELREPLGVVGAISPWNFPLMLLTWKVAPALAFGCTVVAKPAEQSPITTSILAEICAEAGLPNGVFNVVNGFGPGPDACGEAITTHDDVDAVTFTGESGTGRAIMRAAAGNLKKLSFELGGKSPTIVMADADLDEAVAGSLLGSFLNQGEVCLAGNRILVQRDVYDEFCSRMVDGLDEWKLGDPFDEATKVGPLVSMEHLDKVMSYIDGAEAEGAKRLAGGNRVTDGDLAKGAYVQPTIFADVSQDSRICREEVFGPVVTIQPFDTIDDAIRMANDTPYGLAAMVWTQSLNTANRLAREVKAGNIWINCFFVRDLRLPFGGFKQSGSGREGGDFSYEFFTEAKAVVTKLG